MASARAAVGVAVALAAACGCGSKKQADGEREATPERTRNPLPTEILDLEARTMRPYYGVTLSTSGVFVGRELVTGDAALATAAAAATDHRVAIVGEPPVSTVIQNLAVITKAGWKQVDVATMEGSNMRRLCTLQPGTAPALDDTESVRLSIYLQPTQSWIGISRVNEFQLVEDYGSGMDADKLEMYLKEHKASAFFADRSDVELSAEYGVATSRFLVALELACKVGFVDVVMLQPGQLHAKPEL